MICGIQETQARQNQKEVRNDYTWYFSSEPYVDEQPHGVGFIINKNFAKYVYKVVPIDDRIAYIQLRMHGNLLITYITAYAPQAGRDLKLKQNF